jgi:hypothetical protein
VYSRPDATAGAAATCGYSDQRPPPPLPTPPALSPHKHCSQGACLQLLAHAHADRCQRLRSSAQLLGRRQQRAGHRLECSGHLLARRLSVCTVQHLGIAVKSCALCHYAHHITGGCCQDLNRLNTPTAACAHGPVPTCCTWWLCAMPVNALYQMEMEGHCCSSCAERCTPGQNMCSNLPGRILQAAHNCPRYGACLKAHC